MERSIEIHRATKNNQPKTVENAKILLIRAIFLQAKKDNKEKDFFKNWIAPEDLHSMDSR